MWFSIRFIAIYLIGGPIAWALLVLCAVTLARSQEQATPRERAYLERINAEIGGNLNCSAAVVTLQDRIKDLEGKLAEAQKNAAEPPDPKKK